MAWSDRGLVQGLAHRSGRAASGWVLDSLHPVMATLIFVARK